MGKLTLRSALQTTSILFFMCVFGPSSVQARVGYTCPDKAGIHRLKIEYKDVFIASGLWFTNMSFSNLQVCFTIPIYRIDRPAFCIDLGPFQTSANLTRELKGAEFFIGCESY